MSEVATPKKIVKKRGRQPKETSVNDSCRFCERKLTSVGGSNSTFENLFKPSRRQESLNLILADACESVGFKLAPSESLSERVCRICGRKIRNAAELYNFIKEAVTSTNAQEKTTSVDDAERIKRQLPRTVTPERTLAKKFQQENNENLLKEAHNDSKSRRTLFSDSTEDPVIENHCGIETIPIALEQTETEEPLNQNDDFIKNFCNIKPIVAKEVTQLKVVIVYPNAANVVVRETFDDLTKNIIKNLALKKWKPAANQVFKHPELKQYLLEATERGVSEEFANLSKSDTILKGSNADEVIAFSNNILVHETSVMCPLWYASLKGACGKKLANSNKQLSLTNAMAMATASVARSRNPTLSAFAYRVSTILFHSGTKYNDILRLNRLGICMSPEMTVNFQKQMGEKMKKKDNGGKFVSSKHVKNYQM